MIGVLFLQLRDHQPDRPVGLCRIFDECDCPVDDEGFVGMVADVSVKAGVFDNGGAGMGIRSNEVDLLTLLCAMEIERVGLVVVTVT